MIQKVWGEVDEEGNGGDLDAAPRVFFKESWAEYYLWFQEDGDHALDIQLKPGSEKLLKQLGYQRLDQGNIYSIPYGKYVVDTETGICTITHEWPDFHGLNADWIDWANPPAEPAQMLCTVLHIPAEAIHSTFVNG